MTLPLPPQTSEPVRPRRRWGRVVLLVLLAGIGALGWHIHTGQRAVRQLREAGFEADSPDWLGARVWAAARQDWRQVFDSGIWEPRPNVWRLDESRTGKLPNLDAIAPALRRVNPDALDLTGCAVLQNVDGLKGLTGLQALDLRGCATLQHVDGLRGLTGLEYLDLNGCDALQNADGLGALIGLQELDLNFCAALRNVDGLKGMTGLQTLHLSSCGALQDVDGLKGMTGLQTLYLAGCKKIPAPALRELRDALPATVIIFPDVSKSPPQ